MACFSFASLLFVMSCGAAVWANDEKAYAAMSRLESDLFANYNKRVIPVEKLSDSVKVTMGMSAIYFKLDEASNEMILNSYMHQEWTDPRLAWNPEQYGGIDQMNVPMDSVWRPDITQFNHVDMQRDFTKHAPILVIVYASGKVLYVPPVQLKVTCPASEEDEDQRKCHFKLGSWTYSGKKISLQVQENQQSVDLEQAFQANTRGSAWKWESSTLSTQEKFYDCCPNEAYPALEANVVLRKI